MKLKVHKVPRRMKKRKMCGKGDPSQVEATKVWAPPKRDGQGQRHIISGQKNEVFQFQKRPLDCV